MALARVATLAAAVFAGSVQQGNAAFLQKQELTSQWMNQTAIELRFLQEVRGFVGKGPLDKNIPEIKKALEPMWLALPKTNNGRLGNAQVRYALHRFFIQRHGWHIDGLERAASEHVAGNGQALERRKVPAFLMELFEEAFGSSGLMLHELAIFAATLERMIHDESTDRLMDVYRALELPTTGDVELPEVQKAVRAFMMSLMLGQDKLTDVSGVQSEFNRLERVYPHWDSTKVWLDDVRETVQYISSPKLNPFSADAGYSFAQVEDVVQSVSERLGSFQDTECRQLKDTLLEDEERDSGRILLSSFYKKGMATSMQFVEKPEYLRQLGALDESKPGEPRVIVANYILSTNNCLADMGFYSICCINECEGLMGQLERRLAKPEASPAEVLAAIAQLTSSTVESHSPSETMIRRLKDIGRMNGGSVPLHGRLFAQWMHYAFPRECPYPHASGSTNPLSANEWMQAYEEKPNLKVREMRQYLEKVAQDNKAASQSEAAAATEDDVPHWSNEEEILYLPPQAPSQLPGLVAKLALGAAAAACIGVAAVDASKRSGGLSALGMNEKAHLV
eukprot:TRINITY_DN428_c0_g1_i1.p1 TRINITY_DN428_c0_g1~~TRINITY_DN428_c0_g1_i1.p1  ORF type:complete len:565 (-),score=204.10 TRINITY_DN428_c0_g1_i1:213-1907(-)